MQFSLKSLLNFPRSARTQPTQPSGNGKCHPHRPTSLDNIRAGFAGLDTLVPLWNGEKRRYVNLDNAATTPPFREVTEYANSFLDWYSSVHRGTGFKSLLSSHLYEKAREVIAGFFSIDPSYHTVIFCSNATDALNRICSHLCLANDEIVLTTQMEHHSNLLPWRMCGRTEYVHAAPRTGELDLKDLEAKLLMHRGKVRLVAVTAASNITGALPPLRKIARLAHENGALFLVDAAQMAAHRPIAMGNAADPEHIDFLVCSAHKIYAPYGSGALIGPTKSFGDGAPARVGGGTVEMVTLDDVEWSDLPGREEGGSPNLIGVLALAKSISILQNIGMDKVAAHERQLTSYALKKLAAITGISIYGDNDPLLCNDRAGVIPIASDKYEHALLAAILAHEWGIGVRNGCFCAQPYIGCLLDLPQAEIQKSLERLRQGNRLTRPGFVRISFALYNTFEEIDYLAKALQSIVTQGPQARYQATDSGQYLPVDFKPDWDAFFSIQ